MEVAVFAKHLQAWPLEECADRVRAAGFDGLDLTVRPGGYVEPGAGFADRFTAAVKRVRAAGLSVPLITTGITSANDSAAPATMHAAADLGISELKLHYWPWDGRSPLSDAIDDANRELDALEALAMKAGVRINLHNHSGNFVTHSAAAMERLLRGRHPRTVGAYLDPAHFTLEGGLAGWRSSLLALAGRATLLAVKDFRWIDVAGRTEGPQERRWVPVGSGNVRFDEVMPVLHAAGFNGPASIHCEYQGRWSWRQLDAAAVLDQAVADRSAFLACVPPMPEMALTERDGKIE
jgi:L-ribulose-5-phosphate 3-epimerase